MKSHTLNLGVATVAFLASFVMVALSVAASGLLLCVFYWHGTNYPHSYWPVVCAVAGLLAIVAGIHSFRATSRYYRKAGGLVGHDNAA